jgi:tetratricopeptide (TPR) repeat protein
MSGRGVVALILCGLMAVVPTVTRAEGGGGRAAARRAYAEGKRHYDVGDFEPALAAFKRAYLAHEDPVLLYNIAQCQRQLHHPAEALTTYRSYLRKLPEAENRAEVEDTINKLEIETGEKKPPPPPEPTPSPPPVATPAVDVAVTAAPPPKKTPIYKKWWLWTIVGGVVVAGAATGIALGVVHSRSTEPTLPTVVVP